MLEYGELCAPPPVVVVVVRAPSAVRSLVQSSLGEEPRAPTTRGKREILRHMRAGHRDRVVPPGWDVARPHARIDAAGPRRGAATGKPPLRAPTIGYGGVRARAAHTQGPARASRDERRPTHVVSTAARCKREDGARCKVQDRTRGRHARKRGSNRGGGRAPCDCG